MEEKKYTREDAFLRITQAKTGSLAKHLVTYGYLLKLRVELYLWIEQVDEALYR